MIEKLIEHPELLGIGVWAIGLPIYIIGSKILGFKNYKYVWTTTEFKRQFKKYQLHFNEEFKEKNKKIF
jgi:hypothetical protein